MTSAAGDRLAVVLGGIEAPGAFSARRTAPVSDLSLHVTGIGRIQLPLPDDQAKKLYLGEDLGLPPESRLRAELHSMLVYGRGQFFVPHQDSEKADDMVGSLVVTLPSTHTGGALVIEHGNQAATYRPSKTALTFVAFYSDCRHQVRPVRSGYRISLTFNLLLRGDTAVRTESPAISAELAACLHEHFSETVEPRYGVGEPWLPSRLVYLLDHEYTERGLSWSRLKGSDAGRAALLRSAAALAGCETVLALAEVHETWSAFKAGWDDDPWHDRSRWDDWEYDYESGGDGPWDEPGGLADPGDYELQELVDSSIHLGCWLHPEGDHAERIDLRIDDAEACATTRSADLNPYSSEYEGYMGNYGNTMDRWYRRAAVVLWPARLDFAVRAEASARWALDALAKRLGSGDTGSARADAALLAPFWRAGVDAQQHGELLGPALVIATELGEPELAAMLLAPFSIEMLSRAHAVSLAGLVDRYGRPWATQLIGAWTSREVAWSWDGENRPTWLASLPGLCRELRAVKAPGTVAGTVAAVTAPAGTVEAGTVEAGTVATRTAGAGTVAGAAVVGGAVAAQVLALVSWRWLAGQIGQRLALTSPSRRETELGRLGGPAASVLESVAVARPAGQREELEGRREGLGGRREELGGLRAEIVGTCCREDDGLLPFLTATLRSATRLRAAARAATGLDTIARHCADRLEARLARPQRAAGDWSIWLPAGCTCELCEKLGAFLGDAARRSLDWPLRKDRRQHVHSRIDVSELPVRHQTRRTGSPYTLILTKTEDLFGREREARDRDEADLRWLRQRT